MSHQSPFAPLRSHRFRGGPPRRKRRGLSLVRGAMPEPVRVHPSGAQLGTGLAKMRALGAVTTLRAPPSPDQRSKLEAVHIKALSRSERSMKRIDASTKMLARRVKHAYTVKKKSNLDSAGFQSHFTGASLSLRLRRMFSKDVMLQAPIGLLIALFFVANASLVLSFGLVFYAFGETCFDSSTDEPFSFKEVLWLSIHIFTTVGFGSIWPSCAGACRSWRAPQSYEPPRDPSRAPTTRAALPARHLARRCAAAGVFGELLRPSDDHGLYGDAPQQLHAPEPAQAGGLLRQVHHRRRERRQPLAHFPPRPHLSSDSAQLCVCLCLPRGGRGGWVGREWRGRV